MPEIVIPKRHRPILAQLLALGSSQREALLLELRSASSRSAAELADRLSGPVQLVSDEVRAMLHMLASMYRAMSENGETPTTFAALVIKAAKDPSSNLPSGRSWDEEEQFIAELMKLDLALGVSAKAREVMTDHEHVYSKSRVLTDVRPVFASSATEPPAALMVVHTLRISYRTARSSEEPRGFFVALDAPDLEDLRDQIDRALEKEKTLRELFLSKDLPVLEPEELL